MMCPEGGDAGRFSTHADPVWRDRADFIINAFLPEPGCFEQLWVRRVGEDQFEICCIPFFVYDVALGDTVQTVPQYVLSRVLSRSGRYVFRAFFEQTQYRYRGSSIQALHKLGALTEWSSPSLLAVDIVEASAQKVADVLHELEQQRKLVYETGKTA